MLKRSQAEGRTPQMNKLLSAKSTIEMGRDNEDFNLSTKITILSYAGIILNKSEEMNPLSQQEI